MFEFYRDFDMNITFNQKDEIIERQKMRSVFKNQKANNIKMSKQNQKVKHLKNTGVKERCL